MRDNQDIHARVWGIWAGWMMLSHYSVWEWFAHESWFGRGDEGEALGEFIPSHHQRLALGLGQYRRREGGGRSLRM